MANPFTPTTGSSSINAEFFLASASTVATYQTTAGKLRGLLDLSAMIAGDCYQIQRYEKVNGGSPVAIGMPSFPAGVQTGLYELSEGWVNEGWEVGVKLISGSARTLGYALKLDVGDRNVLTWKGTTPANLTTSGYVQSALLRWLTDNAAGTPAALSTNGFVQSMLLRWLTDNAGGTPNALNTGRVDSIIGAVTAAAIAAGAFAANALAAAFDTVLDANAPANARTAKQILNVIVSATSAPGTGLAADGPVSIQDTGGTKPRIVGAVAAGVRTLTSLDGT